MVKKSSLAKGFWISKSPPSGMTGASNGIIVGMPKPPPSGVEGIPTGIFVGEDGLKFESCGMISSAVVGVDVGGAVVAPLIHVTVTVTVAVQEDSPLESVRV